MATKLSAELRQEMKKNARLAVPLVDEQTNQTYYGVSEDFLIQGLELHPQTRAQLIALLNEGEQSGEVSREDAHARIQATIDRFKD